MKRWGAILVVVLLSVAALPMAASAVTNVDLSITKMADQTTVTAGGLAAFTIKVTNNNSETAATGVRVDDQAVNNQGIQSASGVGWVCQAFEQSASCTLSGGLAAGETSDVLHVIVRAPGSPGVMTNTATVSSDQTGPNSASATAQTTVQAADSGSVETFVGAAGATLETHGGQSGFDAKMVVPAGSPAGTYRLTEIPDPVQGSKGAVEYQAPEGAVVTVSVICGIDKCPKRRFLDLLVFVIKTDDDGTRHLLPPCHLVIRNLVIKRAPPCVVSVTRDGDTSPLIWTVKLLGGPDPGVQGR